MTSTADTEEDLKIFEVLCGPDTEMTGGTDMTTTLRSELAALQYKRDSLLLQLQETKAQLRKRDEKAIQLESEIEQLREQAARQNVVIASLRKRIQELEERERTLAASQGRNEMTINTLQRENRYHEEKASELERKISTLEIELNNEEKSKLHVQKNLGDLVHQLEATLGTNSAGNSSHVVQETSRLRNKCDSLENCLTRVEEELRTCRNALSRATADRDTLQNQAATHLAEIDRLKQEREKLQIQQHMYERDLAELREKLNNAQRTISVTTGDIQVQDATIRGLRDDLKLKEEKGLRLETELRHLLESLAILLSSPVRFVESTEISIKDKIRDLINEAKDKSMQVESLHEKVITLKDQVSRLSDQRNEDIRRIKDLQDDKIHVEGRLQKTEIELNTCLMVKEGLRKDKAIFVTFLERLARALNMEEISREIGVDLHTESLLLRAEQLSRFESDKLTDKSAVVYQLQRRVRNLRDQLQRRDLHLDLLRRKLTIQEDSHRTKGLLQAERDEANLRVKKLGKQIDRLQVQLNEARSLSRDLKLQLTESSDYKLTALERGRKIEELQKKLAESELLRTRCSRKVNLLKDQVRVTGDNAEEIRALGEGVASALRSEVDSLRHSLADMTTEKNSLSSLRNTLCNIVGLSCSCADYELISRVTKMADAHREFTKVSRRYDPPTTRYIVDDPLIDDLDSDMNSIYNKRPTRTILP
ncbi:coiled-coil domain-containing protein 170 isoform X2 [Cimex lectularius]|uniref:Coiled-coil domain-containing protein 170 n=1 Tax=Cimex lectularius TaxID=79782 RepID=A0A8I6S2A9_CIMLE|nr:coiled-coil domain-containing protein 170 isoform X2 [Cimex lectularius]